MRIKQYDTLKIVSQFKNVGIAVKELTDAEYDILDKMVKKVKDYAKPVKFDDQSDIIFGKLPENVPPSERVMKDGTSKFSVPMVMEDGIWANFLTTEAEAAMVEGHLGAHIAAVGKLSEKEKEGKTFRNINGYRGAIIIQIGKADEEDGDPTEDPTV